MAHKLTGKVKLQLLQLAGEQASDITQHTWSRACDCVEKAMQVLGSGWWHVSKEVQWGLVAAQVLQIINSQDEEIPAERVRKLAQELEAAARVRLDQTGGTV